MKTFAFAAAALIATASAQEACNFGKIGADFADIVPQVMACQTATSYTIILPSAYPTAAQQAAICSKCTDLIDAASKKTFPSCLIPLADGTKVALVDFFNDVISGCSASSGSSTTAADDSSSSTTIGSTAADDSTTTTGSTAADDSTTTTGSTATAGSVEADTPEVTTTATTAPTTDSSGSESSSGTSTVETPAPSGSGSAAVAVSVSTAAAAVAGVVAAYFL